jgi:hypothetical protein
MTKQTEDTPPRDTVIVPADSAPFRKIIDSTAMLTVARFAWPIVLATLGYLGATQLNDLKEGQRNGLNELRDGQRQVTAQVTKLTDAQASTNNVQSGIVATVAGVVKQIDRLQAQVDGLQKH